MLQQCDVCHGSSIKRGRLDEYRVRTFPGGHLAAMDRRPRRLRPGPGDHQAVIRNQITGAFKQQHPLVLVQQYGLYGGSSDHDPADRMRHEAPDVHAEAHQIYVARYRVEGRRAGYENAGEVDAHALRSPTAPPEGSGTALPTRVPRPWPSMFILRSKSLGLLAAAFASSNDTDPAFTRFMRC